MSAPTLTALFLFKDEHEFLPLSVESIIRDVDEVVLIDNGSSDGSQAIAKEIRESNPSKVRYYEMDGDFDACCEFNNRNKSIKHVHTEWVMVLDADQIISDGWKKWVRGPMADKKYDAIRFRYQHVVGSMEYIHKTFYEKQKDPTLHPDVPLWQTVMYRMRADLECKPACLVNSWFKEQHHANFDQSMKGRRFYNCGSATCWHFGFAKENMMDMSVYRIHRGDYGHDSELKKRMTKELLESGNPFKFIGSVCRGDYRKMDLPSSVREQFNKRYRLELDKDGFIQQRYDINTGKPV